MTTPRPTVPDSPRAGAGARVSSGSDSKQDYATPPDFMRAIESRFGRPGFDLAASGENRKADRYFSADPGDRDAEAIDALAQDWNAVRSLAFLNPPFADIAPWARKCAESREAEILLLVPASVGANWFRDHVFGHADVYLLNGRLCFDGKGLYPKDCILAHYHAKAAGTFAVWTWKADYIAPPPPPKEDA